MKHIILTMIVGLLANAAYTQPATAPTTNTKLDSLAKLSQRFINNNQPDSLYTLMGEEFKKQVPLDKPKQGFLIKPFAG